MTDKSKLVKELFEDTALYLTYDYNLQIRKETIESFTKDLQFSSVLDMPCGTGTISLPLLDRTDKLTFIDISSNMLSMAEKNTPTASKQKVIYINDDFFNIDIPDNSYDLVICLGLLAHVNSPEQLLHKLSRIITPGGLLIIQNTDAAHFYSYLIHGYLKLKSLISKQLYKLNQVKGSFVEHQLETQGLKKIKTYRYNQSFLGFSNLFSNEKKYSMTRNFFGYADNNKHAGWGSDVTYLFKKN
ncbi:MAG: class I SAM-dependent methyltransferase [Bacteroidetes bacterium]|nr:class I SAM-dependent methyltransferase [Bacteroidota bacterium]